jgi:hypothetical protein
VIYMGVDPGKAGALAILGSAGDVLELAPMPVIHASEGKGRDEYDLVGIRQLVQRHLELAEGHLFVTVEKLQPLPPKLGGGIANYSRGVGRGWEWLLVAMGVPYQLVAPQTWQREMHAGTPGSDLKQRSILAASRLFPNVSLKRTHLARIPDDGLAEALLVAEWGRRVHLGGLARGA